MKKYLIIILTLTLALTGIQAHEAGATGPNQGRLLTGLNPHVEFLITPERKVQLSFVGEDGKVIPVTDQIATVTTGDRMAPVKLTFVKAGDSLLSEQPFPAGDNLPAVVQIKSSPEAKSEVERLNVNLAICPGCQKPEYACTCSH